jgi:3-deoxy-D-manno-octulosonic-acid transferase
MIVAYNIVLLVCALVGLPVWLPLIFCSEKRRHNIRLRLWLHSALRPKGLPSRAEPDPIWVHALSVGEVLSAAPLLQGLKERFPFRPVFLSVSTLTGFSIARERFQSLSTWIGYFPLDFPFTVRRAISTVNPALVLMVETDVWPNFMQEMKRRGRPVLFINARLSERSCRGYRRFSFFFRPLFSIFTGICVQSRLDAQRFASLGVPVENIHRMGNLKFDQPAMRYSTRQEGDLRQRLGLEPNQPVWVAGSTHDGEEQMLLEALRQLKQGQPELVMILAPRDPKRAASVCRIALAYGLSAATLSHCGEQPENGGPDVIVVDVMGRLRSLYALADVAFVGGSLVRQGGHNPLEPAAWGKPVLFGPDMRDFLSISHELISAGGAVRVHDADTLHRAVYRLLGQEREAEIMGRQALSVFRAHGGAVERILELVGGIVNPYGGGHP